MATILVLEDKQINEIFGQGSLVIMSNNTWDGFSPAEKKTLKEYADEYDFGGDPDCYVDVITSRNSFFIEEALEAEDS
jgi:hypothetical protein